MTDKNVHFVSWPESIVAAKARFPLGVPMDFGIPEYAIPVIPAYAGMTVG